MVTIFKPSKQRDSLGSVITVKIERLDLNGDGIGYVKNKPIFVTNALPDEVIQVKIIEEKAKFLRGAVVKIETPAANRIAPQCRHFKSCGGCQLQHLSIEDQLTYKQDKIAELFKRQANVQALPWQPSIVANPWHYRRKCRLGVQYNKQNEATVGFRQVASNTLTPIRECPVLPSSASNLLAELPQLINQFAIKKAIGHVEVLFDVYPQIVLVFRVLFKLTHADLTSLNEWSIKHNYLVILQENDAVKSLSESTELPLLSYQINERLKFSFSIDDFIQVNAAVNEQMIAQAITWLDIEEDDQILDLFCGLGNFTLPVALKAKYVVGVEGSQAMVDRASQNAQFNGINNCHFEQGDLNLAWQDQAWLTRQYNKLILDPARAGAQKVVEQINELAVTRIVYISCDPATLARDTKVLLEAGYQLNKINMLDMFSQTKHIECMVLFTKIT